MKILAHTTTLWAFFNFPGLVLVVGGFVWFWVWLADLGMRGIK